MDLKTRAKELQKLGFFDSETSLDKLVDEAQRGGIDSSEAPATALLLAGGKLLEIDAEAVLDLDDYEKLFQRIENFCGGIFKITNVSAESLEHTSETSDGDIEVPDLLRLRFHIDGKSKEAILGDFDDMVDLGFLNEIEDYLESIGEPRRLCPIVELMDDTARYVFHDPEKVDEAELNEIIAAPDFEG